MNTLFLFTAAFLFFASSVSGYEVKNDILKSFHNPFFDYVKAGKNVHKLQPAKIDSSKSGMNAKLSNTPSGYVLTYADESDTCDGNQVAAVAGVGMDVCYEAHDVNGNVTESISYHYEGIEHPITLVARVYETLDCTGNIFQELPAVLPDRCVSDDGSYLSFSFEYTEQTDPWVEQPKGGLLQQVFDSEQSCDKATPQGMFLVVNLDRCFSGMIIRSCSGQYFDSQLYSDKECTNLLSEENFPLEQCFDFKYFPPSTDDDSPKSQGIATYGSLSCV